jgi:ribosomal subunit interface protein
MEITIKGRHWKLTAAFKDSAADRITKLARFYPSLIHAELTITKEGFRHTAEMHLHGSTVDLITKGQDADPLVALDQVLAKQEKALVRHSDRLKDKKKRGAPRRRDAGLPDRNEMPRLPSTKPAGISVVRQKTRAPLLSAEQAARALLKGNKPVLVFSERGTNEGLRVAYRLGDREVALLELE